MKKIDLHIHTVPTVSDSPFVFSLDAFKRYVEEADLNAVAITNHDVFDAPQFREIRDALTIAVFPGIEVNLEQGHLLVISNGLDLDDFQRRANLVSQKIIKKDDRISVDELETIFGDLSSYLVIPHTDKNPSVTGDSLDKLLRYISAGEVDSPKKFIRCVKDSTKHTPVLFSDTRIREDRDKFFMRHTYLDCGEISFDAIKACLRDKTKVALSEGDGNRLFEVFADGQKISTGLNILIGERSSGKTHTLERLKGSIERVKYISQFSLVQQDDAAYEREFASDLQRDRSVFTDVYLSGLKHVLDDVMNIDLNSNERRVEQYVATLLKSAVEADRRDAFSKTALFDEVEFPIGEAGTLNSLIESVRQIIENIEFQDVIERHLDMRALRRLACELIELYRSKLLETKKKKLVNDIVKDVKQQLKMRTSAVQVEDVDLYELSMDGLRIDKFRRIVGFLKNEAVISQETIQGFCIEAKKAPFAGASAVRSANGGRGAFSEAFPEYGDPYRYLRKLLDIDNISRAELYKLFVSISYRILNSDGFAVSGGERSEFRLLQQIMDAQNYDILLIDEPESSFDNLFLKSDVNNILKEISQSMPVVVVTHNSTVGASIGADYLLYAKKEVENGQITYRLYCGYPSDKVLVSIDGRSINNHKVIMDSLEAGLDAYQGRNRGYENIKN